MNKRGLLIHSAVLIIYLSVTCRGVYAKSEIADRRSQLKEIEQVINKDMDLPGNPRLADYIKTGLLRNPGLKAAFYKWKASFNKITKEFSLPDPQFTYTEYLEEVQTRVGPQNRAYAVMQKIPMLDKLWIRKNKAFKASEKAYYEFEKKKLDLTYDITDAYFEYAYIAKAIALTEENMKLLKSFVKVVEAKYTSGTAGNHDLLKVQVELGKLENGLLSLKDFRLPIVARLNALLNLFEGNILPWPDEDLEQVDLTNPYLTRTPGLSDILRKNNPELLALSKKVEEKRQDLRLSKRAYFPDLSVGVKTIDTGDALNPNTSGSGKDPFMLMFSVNVPIWFWKLNARVKEAGASLESAENLLEGKEKDLVSKLAHVHYKLRDAVRQARLYRDALVPKAVQTLNVTRSGYSAGKVDFLSLIDAQRVLLSFQLSYYRYGANTHQRIAELKSLLGEIEGYTEYKVKKEKT